MGYSTDFNGCFEVKPALSPAMKEFVDKLAQTRRMKRNVSSIYGEEGEFYVDDPSDSEANILDGNKPPSTQPGLWLQWIYDEEGQAFGWDQGEKFYNYVEWLEYLIKKVLAPNGYVLNGEVKWQGEDMDDRGKIIVKDNVVTTTELE